MRAPSKPEGACAEQRALSRAAVWPAVSGEWPEWSGQRRVRWLGDSGASWTESQRAREFRPSGQGVGAGRARTPGVPPGWWRSCDPRGASLSPGAGGVGAPRPGGLRPDRRSVPRQPSRRKPSRMEVLDEFDSEFPQTVTFCQLISEEDFERQAATYTERALRRLFRSLDRNPALAERVVRKGKQAECERRGLLSFLWVRPAGRGRGARGGGWAGAGASRRRRLRRLASSALPCPWPSQAKASCAVQGELNCCNSMSALEMHQRLEQLKRRIHRVHLYSQGEPTARCAGPPGSDLPAATLPFQPALSVRTPEARTPFGWEADLCSHGAGEGGAGRRPCSLPHWEGNRGRGHSGGIPCEVA